MYWDYRETCRHDRACMKAVEVNEVRKVIESVLSIET
jgi:hypothetical protein